MDMTFGEELVCAAEFANANDTYAIAVQKVRYGSAGITVGTKKLFCSMSGDCTRLAAVVNFT